MPEALTPIYRDTVRPEWVDYNGHLRDGYYMVIYSLAVDAFMDRIGLDDATRRERHRSIFSLEAHVNFLREIKGGRPLRVDAVVIGGDAKRIHLYMEMFDGDKPEPSSASEQMLLHVDTKDGARSAVFDPDVAQRIAPLRSNAKVRYAGRVIALPSAPRASAGSATDPA
jgi:acyl-CoA thioester hydrolase